MKLFLQLNVFNKCLVHNLYHHNSNVRKIREVIAHF